MARTALTHSRTRRLQAGVLLLHDDFTDTDGVLLENHTPTTNPVGAVWKEAAFESKSIQSNKASSTGSGGDTKDGYVIHVFDGPVRVRAIVQEPDVTGIKGFVIGIRSHDGNNFFGVQVTHVLTAACAVQYVTVAAGVVNLEQTIHTDAALAGTEITLDITDDGETITCLVNDLALGDHTDTPAITTDSHNNYAGSIAYNNSGSATGVMDDIKVWTGSDTLNYAS